MALAVVFKLAKAAVLPTALFSNTAPPVPLALMFKLRAVPSLLIVPLPVMTEALPVADRLTLFARVMAPA